MDAPASTPSDSTSRWTPLPFGFGPKVRHFLLPSVQRTFTAKLLLMPGAQVKITCQAIFGGFMREARQTAMIIHLCKILQGTFMKNAYDGMVLKL
jgi:hypothetical protein